MTFHHRWGGAWRAVPNGTMRVRWGGQWIAPSYCYVKGGGAWRDSGYRGYPAAPVSFALYSHDYNNVRTQWAAGAGGAPVSLYRAVMNNEANNAQVGAWTGTGGVSGNFAVNESTRYHFYVRSETAGGQVSAWVGPIKLAIGKPASTYYTTEDGSRGWSSALSVNGYKDALVGPSVPGDVVCTSVTYNITANAGFTSVLSPYGNREIYRLSNSGQNERFSWGASVNYNLDVGNYWGNGGITGMICRGAGWATGPSSHVARAVGTITAYGTQYYQYQQAHTIPAVANAYW